MENKTIIGAEDKILNDRDIIALFQDYLPQGNLINVVVPRILKSVIELDAESAKKAQIKKLQTEGVAVINMSTLASKNSEIKVGDKVFIHPQVQPVYQITIKSYTMSVIDVNDICLIKK